MQASVLSTEYARYRQNRGNLADCRLERITNRSMQIRVAPDMLNARSANLMAVSEASVQQFTHSRQRFSNGLLDKLQGIAIGVTGRTHWSWDRSIFLGCRNGRARHYDENHH